VAADWSSDLVLLRDNHLSGFSKMAASCFVKVTDEEISNFKENAVPKSTKEAIKCGLKLFRGRKLSCRNLLNFISHKTSFYFKLTCNCLDICLRL
jgi:GTP:adenosylcobinamide-phosphate guanylyltransferase